MDENYIATSNEPLLPSETSTRKGFKRFLRFIFILAVIFGVVAVFFYLSSKNLIPGLPRFISVITTKLNGQPQETPSESTPTPTFAIGTMPAGTQPTFKPTVTPTPTPQPIVKLRTQKLTSAEVIGKAESLSARLGLISVPDNSHFSHTETYRGVEIKWTKRQPIPSKELNWIKSAIDDAPGYFKTWPITSVISMDTSEFTRSVPVNTDIYVAMTNGTNVFLFHKFFTNNAVSELTTKEVLFHQWMFATEYYESVAALSDEYINKNVSGLFDLLNKSPFVEDFGQNVGWVYNAATNRASLKNDSQSRKTTDLGRTSMYEDMASTAQGFLTCQSSDFSNARILWMEKTFGKSSSNFCD